VNLGLALALGGLAAVVAVAGWRGVPWYRRHIEPVVMWVRGLLPSAARESGPTTGAAPRFPGTHSGLRPGADPEPARPPVEAPPPLRDSDRPAFRFADIPEHEPLESPRPRPAGLDFEAAADRVTAYLAGLSDAERERERARLRYLRPLKGYLIRLMQYVPYEAAAPGLRLRDGRALPGTVARCTDSELTLRLHGDAFDAETRRVAWEDLAPVQLLALLDYYMQLRLRQAQTEPDRARRYRAEAADDCLRLALLSDWYGFPSLAQRYAGMATELDTATAAPIGRLLAGIDNHGE
jgi:hypothetical protein